MDRFLISTTLHASRTLPLLPRRLPIPSPPQTWPLPNGPSVKGSWCSKDAGSHSLALKSEPSGGVKEVRDSGRSLVATHQLDHRAAGRGDTRRRLQCQRDLGQLSLETQRILIHICFLLSLAFVHVLLGTSWDSLVWSGARNHGRKGKSHWREYLSK